MSLDRRRSSCGAAGHQYQALQEQKYCIKIDSNRISNLEKERPCSDQSPTPRSPLRIPPKHPMSPPPPPDALTAHYISLFTVHLSALPLPSSPSTQPQPTLAKFLASLESKFTAPSQVEIADEKDVRQAVGVWKAFGAEKLARGEESERSEAVVWVEAFAGRASTKTGETR